MAAYIDDVSTASILVDDSVQAKRYSFFIDLIKKHYAAGPPRRIITWLVAIRLGLPWKYKPNKLDKPFIGFELRFSETI